MGSPMKLLLSIGLAAGAGLAACAPSTDLSTATGSLSTEDNDTSDYCVGILEYVNSASYGALDAYLPAQVASDIVTRRGITPFVSMADISSISGVANARLVFMAQGARNDDFIDEDCLGVFEEHAVSYADGAAILAFVNGATQLELQRAMPENLDAVPYLMSTRPYTTLAALEATPQVGIATFHAIKVAAIDGPFEQLAESFNSYNLEGSLWATPDFNWWNSLYGGDMPGYLSSMTCFGMDSITTEFGGTIDPTLADAAEVVGYIEDTIEYADRFNGFPGSTTAGLADLATWAAGRTFYGCYLSYTPDPWSGVNRAFFIDLETETGVMAETRWSE